MMRQRIEYHHAEDYSNASGAHNTKSLPLASAGLDNLLFVFTREMKRHTVPTSAECIIMTVLLTHPFGARFPWS